MGWKSDWLPRGTDEDFQRALDIFKDLRESPEDPYCLGIEGVKAEIRHLAYWHNAELAIESEFPLSTKTREQLQNIQNAISILESSINSMHKYGWEKLNQIQYPENTLNGWEDIANTSFKLLKPIKFVLQPAINSISQECRKGGWKPTYLHGHPNLHLAQRVRALLHCCNIAHGKTKTHDSKGKLVGGHAERLAAAIKAYATKNCVPNSALRNDVTDACNQSDIEFKLLIAECHYRNARRKFGNNSEQALKIAEHLAALNAEFLGLT